MKKYIYFAIPFLLFVGVIILLYTFYFNHLDYCNPNVDLLTWNSISQIAYNLCYSIIAIFVVFIAYNQLFKTREATNTQSLHTIINRYHGQDMLNKRAAFAKYILNVEGSFEKKILTHNELIKKITTQKKEDLTSDDRNSIADLKNILESVIYEFEIIGYLKFKGIYELTDIYELFSYEFIRYWLLVNEIGFIEYLRKMEADYYTNFENLYKDLISYEVYSKKSEYDITDSKIYEKIQSKKIDLEQFVIEESRLVLNSK